MSKELDRKRLLLSLVFPVIFTLIIWVVRLIDHFDNLELYHLGNLPRNPLGLIGILISPLIHSDFSHITANTLPILILGTGIIFFYRDLAYKVILIIWLFGGALVWLLGRDSYHVGASGLIYGMASFLFFSGVFRKDNRLLSISLLVVFLYGGMIWGIFPVIPNISWEYHLLSGLCGFVLSQWYKNQGPTLPKDPFEDEIEDISGDGEDVSSDSEQQNKLTS